MIKKPTVTIGIPAYNEEANIGLLLNDLLSQNHSSYQLDRLIVYSDGSSDKTNQIVKDTKSKKIVLICQKKRKGIASGINSIFAKAKSDIVVLLNADIRITDKNFIKKIINPIKKNEADLTSCPLKETEPETLVEKILFASMRYKTYIFETYKKGDNLYTCHGPTRAFSQRLYKHIYIKESAAEDMYSYLFCVSRGYKYSFVKNTFIYYKLPDNMKDHESQSVRFALAKDKLSRYFDRRFYDEELKLPLTLHLKALLKTFLKYPLYTPLYVALLGLIMFKAHFLASKTLVDKWRIAESSKVFNRKIL